MFKEALVLAIKEANIFKKITNDNDALSLCASIKAQDQQIPKGLKYRTRLIVHYKIIRKTVNRIIWSETYKNRI